MKKALLILLVLSLLSLSACRVSASDYDRIYNTGYSDGYDAAQGAGLGGYDAESDELSEKLEIAREAIRIATGYLDDYDPADFDVDYLYGLLSDAGDEIGWW